MQIFPGPSELALHAGPWIGCEATALARELLTDLLRRTTPRIYLLGPADSGKTFVLTDICRQLDLRLSWTEPSNLDQARPSTEIVIIEASTAIPLPDAAVTIDWPAPSMERLSALAQQWLDEREVRYAADAITRLSELGQRGLSPLRSICQHAAHVAILNRARLTATLVEEAVWAWDPQFSA